MGQNDGLSLFFETFRQPEVRNGALGAGKTFPLFQFSTISMKCKDSGLQKNFF